MVQDKKWYQNPAWIIALLIFFFPAGLFLMWKYTSWSPKTKWIVTGLVVFIFILGSWNGDSKVEKTEDKTDTIVQTETLATNSPIPSETAQLAGIDQSTKEENPSDQNQETFLVTRVIDGDTIEIQGGQRIRYIGIDTPEIVDPNRPVGCFGQEASNKNKELVLNQRVRLEKDVSETDKYGRLLRYVYTEDETMVNNFLVFEGYATSSTYPPDVKYQDLFKASQEDARTNNRGLWGECQGSKTTNQTPTQVIPSTSQDSGSCNIKGNINSDDEHIYHVPGCQSYSKTQIDTSAGERWFCSESEAVQAGWRKAKNC